MTVLSNQMNRLLSNLGTRGKLKNWLLPGILGVMALLAGVVMPQFLSGGISAAQGPGGKSQESEVQRASDGKAGDENRPTTSPQHLTTVESGKAKNDGYAPPPWPDVPDSRSMLLRLAWGTAVVLVLCVGSLWLLKRWTRGKAVAGSGGSQLRIVDTLAINSRCSIYLLGAGKHQIVAGIDPSGIKALVALPQSFEQSLDDLPRPSESSETSEGWLASNLEGSRHG